MEKLEWTFGPTPLTSHRITWPSMPGPKEMGATAQYIERSIQFFVFMDHTFLLGL